MNTGFDLSDIPFLTSITSEYITLRIFVQPNSKKTECTGVYGKFLRIRVIAPAVENKANGAVLSYLSRYFDVKEKQIYLVAGEQSRMKHIAIYGEVSHLVLQCKLIVQEGISLKNKNK